MPALRPVIISAFGPPSLACVRSWGRNGFAPGMICIKGPEEPKPASRYLAGYICLSKNDLYSDRGVKIISHFLVDFNASGVFCIDERIAQWLNDQRNHLPPEVPLWLPPTEMLQRVLDKVIQIEVARRVGLDVLPTFLFSAPDITPDISVEHFPLCLRPSVPDSAAPPFKVKNIESASDLKDFLGTLVIRQPLIGQPFRNLPNLVVHGARTAIGATVGIKGFIVERKFQGVTLTLRPFSLNDSFKAQCAAFAETMGLVGHYHLEFLHHPSDGRNHFLEINHRFGGTTAKVLACGYEEPQYALQVMGIDCPVHGEVEDVTVSSIKALLKSALFALTGRLTEMDYPQESTARRIWSTLKCLVFCRDEVFAWDDVKGTLAFYIGDFPAKLNRAVYPFRKRNRPGG